MARVTLNAIIDADTKKFDAAIKGAQAGLMTLGKATALADLAIGAAAATTQLLSMGNQIVEASKALGALSFAGVLAGAQAFAVLKLAMNENNAGAKQLKDTWQQMNNDFIKASASVLPGLNAGLKSASALVPVLSRGLSETGTVLGRLAAEAGKVVASPLFQRDIANIMHDNAMSTKNFGEAAIILLEPLRDIAAVSAQVLRELSAGAPVWARSIANMVAAKRASGELAADMRKGIQNLKDFISGIVALAGIIKNVMEAANKASGDTLGKISDKLKEIKRATDENTPGFNRMVEAFRKINEAGSKLWEIFKKIAEQLGNIDLEDLANAFLKITETTVALTPIFVKLVNAFADLVNKTPVPVLQAIVGALVALKLAVLAVKLHDFVSSIGRLAIACWAAIPGVAAYAAAWWSAAAAVIAATWPILLIIVIIAAVIAIALLLYFHWDKVWRFIKDVADAVWQFLQDAWDATVRALYGAWLWFAGLIVDAWNWLWEQASNIFGWIRDTVVGIWNNIWEWCADRWNGFVEFILGAWEGFVGFITGVWDNIFAFITGTWSNIWTWCVDRWNGFVGFIIGAWEGFIGFISGVWNNIYQFITGLWSNIWTWCVDRWNDFVGFIIGAWNGFVGTITGVWNTVYQFITGLWSSIWTWCVDRWNDFVGFIVGAWNGFVGTITGVWNNIYTFITGLWSNIWTWCMDRWNDFVGFIIGAWNGFVGLITGVWNNVYEFITGLWSRIWQWCTDRWNDFLGFITGAWNGFIGFLTGIWDNIFNTITRIWGDIWEWVQNRWDDFLGFITGAWQGFWDFVGRIFGNIYGTITRIWGDIWEWVQNRWEDFLGFITGAWQGFWDFVGRIFGNIYGTITRIWGDIWEWVQNRWEDFRGFFERAVGTFVDTVTGIWERLREIFAAPIRFVVNTVYNDGIRRAANAVLDFVGLPTLPEVSVSFAKGGFRGNEYDSLPKDATIQSGRGRGLVQWAEGETGGEAFIPLGAGKRNRSTMLLGQVASMFGYSLMATGKGMSGPNTGCSGGKCGGSCGPCKTKAADGLIRIRKAEDGFFGSGIGPDVGPDILPNVPSPTDILGGAVDVIDALRDFAEGVPVVGPVLDAIVDFLKDGLCAGIRGLLDFVGDIAGDIAGMAGGRWAETAVAIPRKIADAVIDYVCEKEKTLGVGAGGGVGISQPVQAWAPVALQALALAGSPASELGCLLSRMQKESGGNSGAINLTDSNAAAGVPSQGLMQVIPPTFAAYCAPLCQLGLTNPLANIYAATKYVQSRYGNWCVADSQPGGYDSGGFHGMDDHPGAMIAGVGNGPLVRWAEASTGGEAYIPLGLGKRPASMRVLSDVARRFGMNLKPKAYANMADGGIISFNDGGARWGGNDDWRGGRSNNRWDKNRPAPVYLTTKAGAPVQLGPKLSSIDSLSGILDKGITDIYSVLRLISRNNLQGTKIDPAAAAADRLKKNREIGFQGDLASLLRKGVPQDIIDQLSGLGVDKAGSLVASLATGSPAEQYTFVAAMAGMQGLPPNIGTGPNGSMLSAEEAAALAATGGGSGITINHIEVHGSVVTEKEMWEKAYQYGVHRDKRTGKFGRR